MNNIKNKALKLLSIREHSYSELFTKLKRYSEDSDIIKLVLQDLQNQGYLSEERYVQAYLNSKKHKYGINKIKSNLRAKVKDEDLISSVISTSEIDEYAIAHKLFIKKFMGKKAVDKSDLARQIRFLQYKGFSFDIINKVLKSE